MEQYESQKIVKWSILILLLSFLLIWTISLARNRILTELYGDEIANLNFYETEEVPHYDWFRILSYSETRIEVYFVNELENYEVGGIAIYTCNPYGNWFHQDNVLWSTAGTADTLIWPYFYHISYYLFP